MKVGVTGECTNVILNVYLLRISFHVFVFISFRKKKKSILGQIRNIPEMCLNDDTNGPPARSIPKSMKFH